MINFLKTTSNCGISEFCTDIGVKKTFRYFGYFLYFLKIVIPLLIIVMATIDLFKAITAPSPDEEFKKSIFSIIKRIVAGLLIFFAPTIIYLVIDSIYSFQKIQDCASCLFSPFNCDLSNVEKCEIKVKKIKIDNCKSGSLKLIKGSSQRLYVSFKPSDATNTSVKWKSSKKKIVSINKFGDINAKKTGNVTITASLKDDKSIKAKCKITIKKITDIIPDGNYDNSTISGNGGQNSSVDGFIYYSQDADSWSNIAFCYAGTTAKDNACGAVSLNMVISNLTGSKDTPKEFLNYVCNDLKYHGRYSGEDLLTCSESPGKSVCNKYKIKSETLSGDSGMPSENTFKKMQKALDSGKMLISLVPGHYITIAKNSNNKIVLLDPKGSNKIFGTYSDLKTAYKTAVNTYSQFNGGQYGSVYAYSKK